MHCRGTAIALQGHGDRTAGCPAGYSSGHSTHTRDHIHRASQTQDQRLRQELDNRKLPKAIDKLLDLTMNGNLGRIHHEWDGWNINTKQEHMEGPVVSYGRRLPVTPGRIMSIEIKMQQIAVLQSDKDELKALVEGQKKTIIELEQKTTEQQVLIEKLENRLAEMTGHNVVPVRDSTWRRKDRRDLATPRMPNG